MRIETTNLSVTYIMRQNGAKLTALENINYKVEAGKFICVVGPSGCGKSTLLKVLAGLQKPSAGQVLLDGRPSDIKGGGRAMVFQQASLLPWRTVIRNVTYGLEIQGVVVRSAEKAAKEFIELVGLKGFENSYPHELSGGMQQRVNLARALVTNPTLLLMDEPFASLDPQMRNFMQGEVERIWENTRQTTVFVTHLIDEAIFLADEIVVMTARPGRIKTILPVNFPRPRRLEIKKDPQFHAMADNLSDLINQEFQKMIQDPMDGDTQ